jgi:hypothetical protein
MQKVLNDKHSLIKEERAIWEAEKEEIKKICKYDSEIIKLNIGGTIHMLTEKEILTSVPNSTLAKLFNDMHQLKKSENDEVFLDRDGKTFETLVNYLRNERKVFPEFKDKIDENYFLKELHYWGID